MSDLFRGVTLAGLKSFFLKQKDEIKNNSPILLSKLKNLFITNLDLGLYHLYKGNISDAILRFNLIKLMKNKHHYGWYYLGRCFLVTSKHKKASLMFKKALDFYDSHYPSQFYLGILERKFIGNVPLEIIKEEFEYKAYYYVEKILMQQKYIGHKIIFDQVVAFFGNNVQSIDVLDVGCGSGICAHFFRMCSIGKTIDGIDISSNMLRIAGQCRVEGKAIYDNLLEMDYIQHLSNEEKCYDAIISLLVFNYLCDLKEVLLLCLKKIKENGRVIVVVLTHSDDTEVVFDIKENMFLFSQKYVCDMLQSLYNEYSISYSVSLCSPYENQAGLVISFGHK